MSDYDPKAKIAKRIGEFLLLGAYLVVDFYDVWPESHLRALVIMLVGVVGLVLLDGVLFEGGFSVKRTIVISTFAAIACAIFYFAALATTQKNEIEVVSALEPSNLPTPPNACDNPPIPISDDALKVLIGDNGAFHDGSGKFTVLRVGKCDVLAMERTAQGVEITAELYDAGGNLIATIRKNTFRALSSDNHLVSRRGDLTTLTIKDMDGHELFFAKYLNPTTLLARGVFGCPGHALIRVTDDHPIPGVLMSRNCFIGNDAGAISVR